MSETGFFRRGGELTCDGVALSAIARAAGTPVYVYSAASIEENFRRFDAAFAPVSHLVCYAAKANSNLTLLRQLAALGAGADVVSGGELRAVLECGFPADRVVFSGVGKTLAEIGAGVEAGVLALNAESEREIEKIDAEAARRGRKARVALRVNPDIDAGSHPYISTGRKHNKFGIDIKRARDIFRRAGRFPNTTFVGVQAHIGSQILDPEPLAQSARELAALATSLVEDGHSIETVDVGGGIGIGEGADKTLTPERYAAAVLPHLTGLPFKILIEPGRAIVGPAGVLLTEVLYLKENSGKLFVVTDAGMNDLLRPALYGAIHSIEPVPDFRIGGAPVTADVVGPICETSDFFLRDAEVTRPEEGDLLAIKDVGAYGFAMASNYNFRGRPAEVWVEEGEFRVVRRRETFEDLVRGERE
ncbi:MAG: diaminopimelate decarboxylase [Acidobacteriota bacterium]|nr:diaminopimelate decarboxylase [Acidobacteriota bacterium]MDQ5870680.1 diaminopimelate decarboxylase [Acidobacteriota bacterium]